MSTETTIRSPGEALRLLDYEPEERRSILPWDQISQSRRDSFERRARGTLELAEKIRQLMGKSA